MAMAVRRTSLSLLCSSRLMICGHRGRETRMRTTAATVPHQTGINVDSVVALSVRSLWQHQPHQRGSSGNDKTSEKTKCVTQSTLPKGCHPHAIGTVWCDLITCLAVAGGRVAVSMLQ